MYESCPFCGSNNICFNFDSETKTYNIQCQKCYARTGYAFTHQKAKEAWNQRPYDYDMPAIVKKVQRMEAALKEFANLENWVTSDNWWDFCWIEPKNLEPNNPIEFAKQALGESCKQPE